MCSISLQTDYWHRAETNETHNHTRGIPPAPHRNNQIQYRPTKARLNDTPWIIGGGGVTYTSPHPPTSALPLYLSACAVGVGERNESCLSPQEGYRSARRRPRLKFRLFAQWDAAGKVGQWTNQQTKKCSYYKRNASRISQPWLSKIQVQHSTIHLQTGWSECIWAKI